MRYDMHCHLDFFAQPAALAACLEVREIGGLSVTVLPEDYVRAKAALKGARAFQVGAGLHPWWIAADEMAAQEQVARLLEFMPDTRYVGEIGLDASAHAAAPMEVQRAVFRQIVGACARLGDKVLSLHGVRAVPVLLDELEASGVTRTCTCIFHWFSGSSADLVRARELGCMFSVGSRMLKSKKGRAYVKAIPTEALLLETDLPEDMRSVSGNEAADASQGDAPAADAGTAVLRAQMVAAQMDAALTEALDVLGEILVSPDDGQVAQCERRAALAEQIAAHSAPLLL